jgi:large subunit ribosomal protein L18
MPTRGKVRVIAHRRRREQRTDYRHRLGLLRSGNPRLVVRRSVNSMTCQIVNHDPKGDKTIVSVSAKNLRDFGWKARTGNLPAAYLTGMLCGMEAKKAGIKEAVLDMGLQTSTKGSRIYGCLKGCLDAGIDVPHSPDVLPPVERIRGLHIEEHSKSKGKLAGVSGMFDDVKKNLSSGAAKPAKKSGAKNPKK